VSGNVSGFVRTFAGFLNKLQSAEKSKGKCDGLPGLSMEIIPRNPPWTRSTWR
jgi:hypothetical protein